MVCTNNKEIYEKIRIIRGHGLLRESTDAKLKKNISKKYNKLNNEFLFIYPGYNLRSTEINAIYGLNQIRRLDNNNFIRKKNFEFFLKNLNNEKYFTKFDLDGSCNYAFIVLFNKEYQNLSFRNKFEKKLKKFKIEFRRGLSGGGNKLFNLTQNILKLLKIVGKLQTTNLVHKFGYYIGNYPTLKNSKIKKICNILNSI